MSELCLHMPLFSVSTNVVRITNKNAATPPRGVTADCKIRAHRVICQPLILGALSNTSREVGISAQKGGFGLDLIDS